VTLLEQARLPNPKGSSVDEHCYNTHSSAGRNRHASPWQETLCLAIASADGGVIEDPQFGIFRRVDATAEVPDPQRVPLWRIVKAHSRLFMGFTRAFLRI
jgi:hypothetical protein